MDNDNNSNMNVDTTDIADVTRRFANEVINNQIDCERVCMVLHIDKSTLARFLNDFCVEILFKEITHKDLPEFKRHFFNWLRIAISKKQHQGKTVNCFGDDVEAKQERLKHYVNIIREIREETDIKLPF